MQPEIAQVTGSLNRLTTMMELDRIDIKILSRLQQNARVTNRELAAMVNLAPSSCLTRVNKLRRSGLILASTTQLNLEMLTPSVTCIAAISLASHNVEDFQHFESLVAGLQEVVECYTVSGDCDFILRIVCRDMTHYGSLSDRIINSGPHVENIKSYVVMRENKRFSGYSLSNLLAVD